MKETSFIQQNKDKWRKFEELNKAKSKDPDELSRLFVEITEDLSYARTYYPKRSVRVYLNFLAQNVFNSLYKIRLNPFKKFTQFWTINLPLELYRARWNMLYAFLIFSISMLVGVLSTANDINFARVILSDGYVEMTNDYINKGDPMAVYKDSESLPMFLRIFFNNFRVALMCFILGIFFSIGTSFFLVFNGIMVGTFQSYFYFKGLATSAAIGKQLLLTSFLTIWIHGAFEISAIVIAGGAGLTLGNGLLFPGTYTKIQSLQITAKRGLKIMLGLVPFFFIAAIFESWVTRHTEMPDYAKWMIIIGSFLIIISYFVLYPFVVARRHPAMVETSEEPLHHPKRKVEQYKIRQPNEMFSEAFALYRNSSEYFSRSIWSVCIPLNLAFLALQAVFFNFDFTAPLGIFGLITQNYQISGFAWLAALSTAFVLSLNASIVIHALRYYYSKKTEDFKTSRRRFVFRNTFKIFLPLSLMIFWLHYSHNVFLFLGIFILPVVLFTLYPLLTSNSFFKTFFNSISMGFRSWSQAFLLTVILGLIILCFTLLFSGAAQLGQILLEMIQWHFVHTNVHYNLVENLVIGGIMIVFIHIIFPIIVFSFCLLYFSQEEKEQGISLFERLKNFGKKNKNYETEFEQHEE